MKKFLLLGLSLFLWGQTANALDHHAHVDEYVAAQVKKDQKLTAEEIRLGGKKFPSAEEVAKFPRGAKPTPQARKDTIVKHVVVKTTPTSLFMVPKQLSMWLNDTFGDCVTAEEAAAKAAYSILMGQSELFIPDSVVQTWARANGDLNGALLPDVMNQMSASGFNVNGTIYGDGPYTSVDYTTPATLTNAIAQGPIKIGVASSQFNNIQGVGSVNGWFMTGFTQANPNDEDHCVSLFGFGTLGQCFQVLGVPVPSNVKDPTAPGYLLFTWSTIGVIDQPSMLAVTFEAYLRSPTTVVGGGPAPPSPNPNPQPNPQPTPTPTPCPYKIRKWLCPSEGYAAPASTRIGILPHPILNAIRSRRGVGSSCGQ
jgi:hypothetical protein